LHIYDFPAHNNPQPIESESRRIYGRDTLNRIDCRSLKRMVKTIL